MFFSYSIWINPCLWMGQVEEILATIPNEDRQDLERLFHSLLMRDDFGYGLFGGKSVCLSGHFTLTPYENWIEGSAGGGTFWKQWEVWEKYKMHFPMKNYLLIKESGMIDNNELIVLINKKLFTKVINKNQDIFERILKHKVDPYQLIEDLETGKSSLKTSINNNIVLWAVLLGYGIHNGLYYVHRGKILKLNCLKGFGRDDFSLQTVGSISFMYDPFHVESKKLKLKYELIRRSLSKIYSKGDLLNITLFKLTE